MDPSNQIQRLGQQEYRRKNYHAALNFFNSVISTEQHLDVSVLDCRAATYEKLGDLHTALKDGRRMISDYKTDCAGYLRTGKILQLLDKDSVALGIYKYGLRNVSSSASQYQLLRDIHDSMNQKCGPRKAKDPLTVLPMEIAQMIMSYLDFKHVVSLTRVSTTWRDYLKSTPGLWATLDFSRAKADVPKTAIQKYIRFSRGTVSRLTTQQSINLQHVVTQCKTLEHLEIGDQGPRPELRTDGIAELSLSCASDLSLECLVWLLGPKFDGLRKLHLPQCMEITDIGLRNLINMGLIDHVVDLDLSGPRLTDSLIQLLAFRAFRLERVKVASTAITGVGVKALVTKPGSKLQYLDITDCMHVASDAVAFARHLKGLKVKCGQEEFRGKKKKIRFE
ncbi:MAG: hypothetical protein L6R38_009247 [Xanthoria sp. 2 TBL-2021]|nr:MAG: hypothetical protein L6R38_009247 [Xanthoria sp. 2 TBL-2021]